MTERTAQESQTLISFWDKAFAMSEEEKKHMLEGEVEDWKDLAPSEKLFKAACALGQRKKVLDYGCGNAWASIIAAKSGCVDVTAVDAAPGAVQAARFYAMRYGVSGCVNSECVSSDWLQGIPAGAYDGLICSNVLDVVPPETAETIIQELGRVTARDGIVVIGLKIITWLRKWPQQRAWNWWTAIGCTSTAFSGSSPERMRNGRVSFRLGMQSRSWNISHGREKRRKPGACSG